MNALSERFELRLDEETIAAIDEWRRRQDGLPSRAEAIRRLVDSALSAERGRITLTTGEQLLVYLLCDVQKVLKRKPPDFDTDFIEAAVAEGRLWALDWEYPNSFNHDQDAPDAVGEVVDILEMWDMIERSFADVDKKTKDLVAAELKPLTVRAKFEGFDGNYEGSYAGIARFIIGRLGRFEVFKGRDLRTVGPAMEDYRRMLAIYRPMRKRLIGGALSAAEIIDLLKARHGSRRTEKPRD